MEEMSISVNGPPEEAEVSLADAKLDGAGLSAEPRDVFLRKLGMRLRELRRLKGLTQEDFDDDTPLSVTTRGVQGIEYGEKNPKIYTLYKMSQRLGLNLSEILDI